MRYDPDRVDRTRWWHWIGILIFLFILWMSFVHDGGKVKAQPTAVGPANAILCNNSAIFIGSVTLAQIVGPPTGPGTNPNARIYLCGWHITNTGATGTFDLEYGTGTNCGANTVNLTGVLNVTSTAPSADHTDFATTNSPQAGEICQISSATAVTGVIWYSQF